MEAIHLPAFVQTYSTLTPSTIPIPSPTATAPILVRVTHAALNYVDLLYSRGKHQNNRSLVRPPFTLGLEFAGVVVRGPSSSAFRAGDRVFGSCSSGAYAEYVAAEEGKLRKVPAGWSLRQAAGVAATAPVAYGALVRRAKLAAGETVLVHSGAGGLGVMACQIAQALGANVVATVGSPSKARVLWEQLGVRDVVLYGNDGWEKEVLKVTGGKGVDVVFDTVGLVEKSIRCTAYAGRILVVGFAGSEGNLESIAANRILLKAVDVLGYRYGEHARRFAGEHETIWEELEKLLAAGKIKSVVYDKQFKGLASVPVAMQAMVDRKVYGKAVIDIADEYQDQPRL